MRAFENFLFKKLLLRNYLLDFYQISQECSLDRGKKLLFTVTEKPGLWSYTDAQAPLVKVKKTAKFDVCGMRSIPVTWKDSVDR